MQKVTGSSPVTRSTEPKLSSAGVAQLARASACHAEGHGFESRYPLHFSVIAPYLRPIHPNFRVNLRAETKRPIIKRYTNQNQDRKRKIIMTQNQTRAGNSGNKSSGAPKDAQKAVIEFLKNFSCQQFSKYYTEARTEDLSETRDLKHDHWVACVALPMVNVSVNFQVHFTSAQSRALLSMASSTNPRSIKPSTAQDSLKEYCNLVMGKLKSVLRTELTGDEATRVFLPNIDPSFDNFGKVPTGKEDLIQEAWWRIIWDGGELLAYGKANVKQSFNQNTIQQLNKESSLMAIDDEGDVDFFDF